jgi:hypothetical protein
VYIQKIYTELQEIEKNRLQNQSITTAYLTDSILSIAHALYGKSSEKYKSQPEVFLPGYSPEEDADPETLSLDSETLAVCLIELQVARIPNFARPLLVQILNENSNANQQNTNT